MTSAVAQKLDVAYMQAKRDFDLADLDAFIVVCETGSMTEAAKRLGLTESAVSHLIRRMESRLSVTLFDRSTRPLKPTVLGTQLFSRGQQLLRDASGINQELKTKGRVRHAHLGIGLIETLGTWFATNLVEQLAANSRSWTIVSGNNSELWERFRARELSALVVLDDDAQHEGAAKYPLLTESLVLITPPLLSHLSLVELANGVPLVGAHKESGLGRLTASYLSRVKIDIAPTATFGSLDAVLMMVAHGFGWALAPSLLLLRDSPERHQVHIRPLEKSTISRQITLVTRQYELGALTDLIRDNARKVFEGHLSRIRHQHPELAAKLSFAFPE